MKKTSLLLALLVAASLRAQDGIAFENAPVEAVLQAYAEISGKTLVIAENLTRVSITHKAVSQGLPLDEMLAEMENALFKAGIEIVRLDHERVNVGPVQKRQAQRPPLRGDFPMPWRLDPDSPDEWPMPTDNLAAFELMLALNPANTRYRERLEKRRLELLVQRAARTPAGLTGGSV